MTYLQQREHLFAPLAAPVQAPGVQAYPQPFGMRGIRPKAVLIASPQEGGALFALCDRLVCFVGATTKPAH